MSRPSSPPTTTRRPLYLQIEFSPNPAAKQALDFATSFPALSFAFDTGCEIRIHGAEEGTCAISVTNKGR